VFLTDNSVDQNVLLNAVLSYSAIISKIIFYSENNHLYHKKFTLIDGVLVCCACCFVQGFQLLKNGKPYGSVIPSDVHSLAVRGLKLGDKVELQLVTLTSRAPAASQSHKSKLS